jgi:phospholipid-binding lipoprotein MlaA
MRIFLCHKLDNGLMLLSRNMLMMLVVVVMTGCSTVSQQQTAGTAAEVYDPIEPVNRIIFAFNDAVDVAILRPIAVIYDDGLSDPIKDSVRNFLRWLRSPIILANDILQGDLDAAASTSERFFLNATTFGLADVAGDQSIAYRSEDFGQTLAVHNVSTGPYLVLPFLGPSNLRDLIGIVVDNILDPLSTPVTVFDAQTTAQTIGVSRRALSIVDFRSRSLKEIDNLKRETLDYYASARTIYNQRRVSQILNGTLPSETSNQPTDTLFNSFEPTEDGIKPAQSGQPLVTN